MNTGRRPGPVLSFAFAALVCILPARAATLTVNSLSDDTTPANGLVTLREAVAAANGDTPTDLGQTGSGADTIVFEAALAAGTINLATAAGSTFGPSALVVTSEITIDGAAAPMLTISRAAAVARLRHFHVAPGATLRLKNITVANGVARGYDGGATHRGGTGGGGAGLGGAIFNEGTLEVTQATLHSNQATGGSGGPQSNIFDTYPRGGSGAGGTAGNGGAPTGGGGIDTGGTGGAGGGGAGGNGGDGSCTAGATGAFGGGGGGGGGCANNPACAGGAGGFGGGGGGGGGRQTGLEYGAGGAAGFGGGAGGNGTGSDAITAPGGGGGGGAGLGGAVFNHGGTVSVTNSTLSANSAQGGTGGRNGSGGQGLGGAIFNRNGTLTMLAATVNGSSGGGIYNLGDGANASATIDGSILANSAGGDFTGSGTQTAVGSGNLIESQSGFTGSIASTADPQLAALADNDGPTETHLPAMTSPALDASTLSSPAQDQRGVVRPQGAARDIGSVEVVDNQPPVAVCNAVTISADANCVATVSASTLGAGSSDPDGDPITITVSPAGPYALGTTNVTVTVTDDGGLFDTCDTTVTVEDTTAPEIDCPDDVTLECPADTTPASTGTATASDNCSTPVVTYSDLTTPGCGGTVTIQRTWLATDAAGNSSSCVQTIQTVDTTAPTITPGANNTICLWPPNGKYVYIDNVTAAVQLSDACDSEPEVASVSCVSSQCDDAPCTAHPGENGDGTTVNDCVYDPLLDRLAVRSERAGTDPAGRTYSLIMTAVDACGNGSAPTVVFTVHVPHSAVPGQQCVKP